MLSLRCINPDKGGTYTFLVDKVYTVGRKGCDITFQNDQTISRTHAEVSVCHAQGNLTNPNLTPCLVLTDLGSSLGTFFNDGIESKSKIAMRESVNLHKGDRVRFGLQWNEYEVDYTPLIVTSSTLTNEELDDLREVIWKLGGHLSPEFSDVCEFVVMSEITFTATAICAILRAKFIVTPSFFQDLLSAVQLPNKPRPNPINYVPRFAERQLENSTYSFEPTDERKTVFEGKNFVFLTSKTLKKLGKLATSGGGVALDIKDVSVNQIKMDNYIIITMDLNPSIPDNISFKVDAYKRTKRFVLATELSLAALYISTEKHCNPFFDLEKNQPRDVKGASSANPSKSNVYVPETQDDILTQKSDWNTTRNIIDESFMENSCNDAVQSTSGNKTDVGRDNQPRTHKRMHSESEEDCSPKKRPTRTGVSSVTNQNATSQKSLSNLFGMSDSEDEDEEFILPATPPPNNVENVQEDIQRMETKRQTNNSNNHANDTELNFHDSQTPGPSNSTAIQSRSKRKLPTPDVSPIKLESPVKAKRLKSSKIENEFDDNAITKKLEKTTLVSGKNGSNSVIPQDLKPISGSCEIFVPLLKTARSNQMAQVQSVDGKQVKNFKTFRKVYPKYFQSTVDESFNIDEGNTSYERKVIPMKVYRESSFIDESTEDHQNNSNPGNNDENNDKVMSGGNRENSLASDCQLNSTETTRTLRSRGRIPSQAQIKIKPLPQLPDEDDEDDMWNFR